MRKKKRGGQSETRKNGYSDSETGCLPACVTIVFCLAAVSFLSLAQISYAGPSITNLNPGSGASIGGYKLTIYGTGFLKAAHVTVGGNICALKTQSAREIVCIVPPYTPPPKPGSTAPVQVFATIGGINTNSLTFTYTGK